MQGAKALLMAFCRKSSLRTQRRFTYTNYYNASQEIRLGKGARRQRDGEEEG